MVQLTEWTASGPLELTHGQIRALEAHFDARVRQAEEPGRVLVTPGSVIGSMRIGETTVTVAPKIPIDRVLFMTAYTSDPVGWKDEVSDVGTAQDLVLGMARLVIRACDQALQKGLLRSYRSEQGDLPYLRGRIDWARQVRRPAPVPLAVRYTVHDDDILENQIIRATLAALRELTFNSVESEDVQSGLMRLWRVFRDFRPLGTPLTSLDRLVWTRSNEHYRPLLDLCRVILSNHTVEVRSGNLGVQGFTLKLPEVFEQFVRRAMEQFAACSLATPTAGALTLDEGGRIHLHPDLAACSRGRWTYVGDVKYKRDGAEGKNADIYQMLAYATAAHLQEATLIYAEGPREVTEHEVRFAGVRLHVERLALRRPPQEVLRQIAVLAQRVRSAETTGPAMAS